MEHLHTAEKLVNLLENRFIIFGKRFGIDPVLGLIPGGGDAVSLLLSLYLVWIGLQLRLPQEKIARMIANIMLDFLIGLVPLFGDVVDFAYKANTRNLTILKQSLQEGIIQTEE